MNGISHPLVSVVIPIYNTEKYLEKCINSALNQTYRNIEIILVDDGSTDLSGNLCDDFSRRDSRIKVIHKKNGGVVSARKAGVLASSGEYITQVDSDDWLDETFIEKLTNKMLYYHCEIAQAGAIIECENREQNQIPDIVQEGFYDFTKLDCEIFGKFFINDSGTMSFGLRPFLWSCIFKRELMEKSQMMLPDQLVNGDDDACFYAAALMALSFYKLDEALYHYRLREGSLSHTAGFYGLDQIVRIDQVIRPLVQKHIAASRIEKQLNRFLIYLINIHLRNAWKISFREQYRFPYEIVPPKSRLIIYGAGMVGQSYVVQIEEGGYCSFVGWADKNYGYVLQGHKIESIKNMIDIVFDYILIAVADNKIMEEIKRFLIGMGVADNQILWEKPKILPKSFLLYENINR